MWWRLGELNRCTRSAAWMLGAAYLLGLVRTPELSPTFNAYDMADSSLEILLYHTYTRVRCLEATFSPLPDCIIYESQTLKNLATIKPKIPCQPTGQIGRGARSQITSSNRVIFQHTSGERHFRCSSTACRCYPMESPSCTSIASKIASAHSETVILL